VSETGDDSTFATRAIIHDKESRHCQTLIHGGVVLFKMAAITHHLFPSAMNHDETFYWREIIMERCALHAGH